MRVFILATFLLYSAISASVSLIDKRYCGEPARTATGKIKRSKSVLRHFKKIHPCPVTGKSTGRCKGWSIDHVIPLACGGCDAIENLQWLPNVIKSAKGKYPKDRWERKIYCNPMRVVK